MVKKISRLRKGYLLFWTLYYLLGFENNSKNRIYTICWDLETIQKIRHVGSDFFYTWIGLTNKERSHVSIEP